MDGEAYAIVSPVRDEESFLRETIQSVVSQTLLPRVWIIVDDGSTDNTAAIAKASALAYPWIKVIERTNRGFRAPGTGVITAFNEGYRLIADEEWSYLVKLDGDLSFEPTYFEECFRRFARDPKLGIGGGTICQGVNGALEVEAPGDPCFHVRGATKVYKRECWKALGGLMEAAGWDTVDEYKANMLGWNTYTFPEIRLRHHRHAGGAEGTWKNWVKNGLANYVAGYHPLFMWCKCGKRMFRKPYGIGGLGLFIGFLSGYFTRYPRVNDPELIRYVRQQQLRKLCFRESLWDRTAEFADGV
jgi:poly-beta-1,6-N-acetyl-D-glucosamine synthase